MALARLKTRFTLQVDVAGKKNPLFNILIQGTDRNAQFRMIGHDLIGRLPIGDEWGDHGVNGMELFSGQIDTGPGGNEHFFVFALSKERVVVIFGSNCTAVQRFEATIADIGSPGKTVATLFYEMPADLIAFETGGAFAFTKEKLLADIGPAALKAFDAEVTGVSDRPLMK